MSQTERLLWIDREIRDGHYPNVDSVMQEFGVGRRTAYSDRDALITNFGAPLKNDRSRKGWYYTEKTFALPAIAISVSEAAALSRSLLTAVEYLGPRDAKALARIANLLSKHLPPLQAAPKVSASGAIHAANAGPQEALVDECLRAIDDRQKLRIGYDGAHRGEYSERTIHPYHLDINRGEYHLVAYCELRKDVRQFLLGRVRHWRPEGPAGSYTITPDFDVQQYLHQGFAAMHGDELVTVTIKFSPYESRWIRERIWHPSQVLKEQPDGSVELTVSVAGTAEVKRWILGYGPEAVVVAPEALRAEIVGDLKKMSKNYGED